MVPLKELLFYINWLGRGARGSEFIYFSEWPKDKGPRYCTVNLYKMYKVIRKSLNWIKDQKLATLYLFSRLTVQYLARLSTIVVLHPHYIKDQRFFTTTITVLIIEDIPKLKTLWILIQILVTNLYKTNISRPTTTFKETITWKIQLHVKSYIPH